MTSNALDMSDEDFLNAPMPEDPPEAAEEPVEASEDEGDSEVAIEEEEGSESLTEASEDNDEEGEQEDTEVSSESNQDDKQEGDQDGLQEGQEEADEVESTDKEVDYKAFYDELTAPFKANGKDMKVDSIADARQLMQMGANYNKKMAAIKPHLKLVKTLEKANIDETKLNYLLDLDNKNPDAIKKLLKDSEIDPLDIDTNTELDYKPNSYTASDKEVELDQILGDIQETESFNRTIDIIGNKWDEKSKQVLVDQPEVIKVINEHVGTGIYDQIMTVVDRERVLGRLTGLSDIEAYKTVGDALNAQGAFNKPTMSKEPHTGVKATNNKVDPKLAARKKAASSTKSKTTVKKKPDFNPLAMSDEEFEKQINGKFI